MKKLINSLKPIVKNNSDKKKQESLEDISKKRMLSSGKMNEFLRTKFETKNGSFKNSNMQKLASSSEKNINRNSPITSIQSLILLSPYKRVSENQ